MAHASIYGKKNGPFGWTRFDLIQNSEHVHEDIKNLIEKIIELPNLEVPKS